jgi:hypothetical protein
VTEDELIRRLDRTIEHNSEVIELNALVFEPMVQSDRDLKRTVARLDRSMDDLRDQIAANTVALLRLIDRLGPEPAT